MPGDEPKDDIPVPGQVDKGSSLNAAMQQNPTYQCSVALKDSRKQCPIAAGGGPSPALDSNMRQFHVLDEIGNESSKGSGDEDDDRNESFDDDVVSDDNVEQLLDAALKSSERKRTADGAFVDQPYKEKQKIILIDKGSNHFDVLPEGWIEVTHNSGMNVYLHKQGRVCTMSKPYYLGPGSARKHDVPLSAIPCLNYRKALDAESKAATESPERKRLPSTNPATTDDNTSAIASAKSSGVEEISDPRVEISTDNCTPSTSAENVRINSLEPAEVTAYCKKLFQFDNISVVRFRSWADRRQYSKRRKQEKQLQRPTLPDGTKLISFPIPPSDGDVNPKNTKKEFIMNPNGKSYVCILHEYVQHALKKQPTYKYMELENAATPYAATVSINDMQYGMGYGSSKKQAKSEAAKATLEILMPEMRTKITADEKTGGTNISKAQHEDLSFFDEIKIEDPRVAEFCAKTTEPSPHDILLTCLQRNFGLGDLKISYEGNTLKHQKNEFTMTVGKHTSTVVCKNKRDGKQRASQAILQALHPHVKSWGSLLRLYGNRSVKSFKEKKLEEQEITQLQSKATANKPNVAILDKLRTELLKLHAQRQAIRPIGLFGVPANEVLPNLSGSGLRNVDL